MRYFQVEKNIHGVKKNFERKKVYNTVMVRTKMKDFTKKHLTKVEHATKKQKEKELWDVSGILKID